MIPNKSMMTFGEILKPRWKPYYSYFHDFLILI